MKPPRVYVAHPVTCYGTEHEARSLAALRLLLPHCELLDPSQLYASAEHWLRAWPKVLLTLAGLVVFGAEDCSIGAGCVRELSDALAMGVAVVGFDGEQLREIDGLRLFALPWRDRSRVGTLVLGPVFEPSALFPTDFDGAVR